MARRFSAAAAVLLMVLLPHRVNAEQEAGDFVFYQHEEDDSGGLEAPSGENDFSGNPVDQARLARVNRMKELEDRFRSLSASLSAMPAPPEVRGKTISFGESSSGGTSESQ